MNYILYAKGADNKKFQAIGSLKKMTYAPNLLYAALIPESRLERLKEFCNHIFTMDNSVSLQIRKAGTNKVIFEKKS